MAIKILWEKSEAAYLLHGLIRTLNNEISRKEAIQEISDTLRKRAVQKGMEIDDIFRNINGITLQMKVMEYIYTEGKQGLKKSSMPKLFQDVVDLYKYDKNSYEKLVKEVVIMTDDKMIEEQFYMWLSSKVSPSLLSDLYGVFRDINIFCLDRKILKKPLFETVDLSVINSVRMTVDRNKVFKFKYRRQHAKMSLGMKYYITFIKEHYELKGCDEKVKDENIEDKKNEECESKVNVIEDKLIKLITDQGINYVDNREKKGCLWIIGGTELEDFAKECRSQGVFFHYKEEGGNTTMGKSAWWTKDYYKELKLNENSMIDSKIHSENEKEEKIYFVNFEDCNKLSVAKPISFAYFGEEHLNLLSWKELYVEVIRCLYEDYPDALLSYINKNLFGKNKIDFANEFQKSNMVEPECISDDFYLETDFNVVDIMEKIKYILDFCRVDYENLEIQYIIEMNDEERNIDFANKDLMISQEIKEKYGYILKTFFGEDGYQPGRAIFRGRFKRFYSSEYGVEPTETDDCIDNLLKQIGTIRDGRIYPNQDIEQNDLMEKIREDILSAFDEGATGIYIEAIFNKYHLQLAENLQIYNVDALVSLLDDYDNEKITKTSLCFIKNGEDANPMKDILRIMKLCHLPQNYEDIHKKVWYIPYDKMKTLLMSEKSIVIVAPETYFYAPNLPVNSGEISQLITAIEMELEYRTYITDVELMELIQTKCPTIALNTDEFTTYGLRNCLRYILREKFSFNGPIISRLGKEISMSDVYAEFASTHQELCLNELKNLSLEMNTSIYWESVLGEMIRVSDQKMIRRDCIEFNVEEIDELLDKMCPGEYVAMKDVNLFLQFPNIGHAWNHYVLESYLFKNSRKFKLIHVSFVQNNVCGAMVRVESNISDYRALIVDVLSKSDALGSVKEALQYIVDRGYQNRRRYEGIEQLIKEAKIIKEQREKKEK